MLKSKQETRVDYQVVLDKKDAALQWCRHASNHARTHGGKPWTYVLIPHDVIAENMTLKGLAKEYRCS